MTPKDAIACFGVTFGVTLNLKWQGQKEQQKKKYMQRVRIF